MLEAGHSGDGRHGGLLSWRVLTRQVYAILPVIIIGVAFMLLISSGLGPQTPGDPSYAAITRDTSLSTSAGEINTSNGATARLKLKGNQELVLLDIDPAPLRGRRIEQATLHVKIVDPKIPLKRVSFSTLGAEWTEGRGNNYAVVDGASTFRHRLHPDVPWSAGRLSASGYSDLTQVMFATGGTFWNSADATPPDASGWQSIAVDPKILAARVAGLSGGVVMFDDTGTELVRSGVNGETVLIDYFPNRVFYARESGPDAAPYFTLRLAEESNLPPPVAPGNLRGESAALPPGEALVYWDIPAWNEVKIIGFLVKINGQPAERPTIPAPSFKDPSRPQTITMRLRDLALPPGATVRVEVAAVDETGQSGPWASLSLALAGRSPVSLLTEFAGQTLPETRPAGSEYKLYLPGGAPATLAIVDELDKVSAAGNLLPARPATYLQGNHVWDSTGNRVRLYAARNEFIGFQIYLDGTIPLVNAQFRWEKTPARGREDSMPRVTFSRFGYVNSSVGLVPDPVIPLKSNDRLNVKGKVALFAEIFVPTGVTPGVHAGMLTLRSGSSVIYAAQVDLTVWNFALPDTLSFLPEMNCYGLPGNERDYYRMAQLHRTYINSVPYSHRGNVSHGCAPGWDAEKRRFNWKEWDKR